MDQQRILGTYKGLRGESGPSLTDRAYLQIEEMIVTLQLEPGQLFSEADLMSELGIGRTPIREALSNSHFDFAVL